MKIIFLIRSLNVGGAERQLSVLASELANGGHDIKVISFYSGGKFRSVLETSGVQVIDLKKIGRWDLLYPIWRLIRIVNNNKPDVLYAWMPLANMISILIKPFIRSTKIVWGVRASNMDLSYYDRIDSTFYPVEAFLSRFSDLIISNSHLGRRYAIENGFRGRKFEVIPNGIDIHIFRPMPDAGEKLRGNWGVDNHQILIGLVGRLDPMKGHPYFLKSAAILAERRDDVRFVCIGDGSELYKRELREMSYDLGLDPVMIWAGECGDMPAIYNSLDIMVSSSSYGEGFPNVIGEAMACDVFCIVTDVGDSSLIVGDLGSIIQPKDVNALVESIQNRLISIESNKVTLGQTCRNHIVERFSVQTLSHQTESLLESLLYE